MILFIIIIIFFFLSSLVQILGLHLDYMKLDDEDTGTLCLVSLDLVYLPKQNEANSVFIMVDWACWVALV